MVVRTRVLDGPGAEVSTAHELLCSVWFAGNNFIGPHETGILLSNVANRSEG